jgi:hypothetical protein
MRRIVFIVIILLMLAPSVLAQTPEATEEPSDDIDISTVPIKSSGIEIFVEPDRQSERLYAILGMYPFAPFVAGVDESGEWLLVYLYDGGELVGGWARVVNFDDENQPETWLDDLTLIDPDDLPEIPDPDFDPLAVRPVGVSGGDGEVTSQIFEAYGCRLLEDDVYEWSVVEVIYQDDIPVEARILDEGVIGEFQPGCPETTDE